MKLSKRRARILAQQAWDTGVFNSYNEAGLYGITLPSDGYHVTWKIRNGAPYAVVVVPILNIKQKEF